MDAGAPMRLRRIEGSEHSVLSEVRADATESEVGVQAGEAPAVGAQAEGSTSVDCDDMVIPRYGVFVWDAYRRRYGCVECSDDLDALKEKYGPADVVPMRSPAQR